MKKYGILIIILFQLLIPGIVTAGEIRPPLYLFHHNDVGTVANYILLNGKERGIRFDESSDKSALKALRCLKPSIFLPNSGEHPHIILEGELHPEVHRTPDAPNRLQSEEYQYFTLRKWYILVPFTENTYYSADNPLEAKSVIVSRTSLNKDDFDCETGIDMEGLLMHQEVRSGDTAR